MDHSAFTMYDDDAISPRAPAATSYRPAWFPTWSIVTPIVILYGDGNGLVDSNRVGMGSECQTKQEQLDFLRQNPYTYEKRCNMPPPHYDFLIKVSRFYTNSTFF
jgi:hypothetical protein